MHESNIMEEMQEAKHFTGETIQLTAESTITAVPEIEDYNESIEKAIADGAKVSKGLSFGEVEVLVSNSATDRHGEKIIMEGIDTSQIKRNPVVLWGHQYSNLPIGQITKIWRTNGNLMARIKLDTDIYEFANTVYQMILRGTINAVSIGGIVKQWSSDFTTIEKMEMVELSVVPVGAHPDALVTAKSLGMEPSVLKEQFETFVKQSIVDSYKDVEKNTIIDHIASLKEILAALEGHLAQSEKQETKAARKVKLVTLKGLAGQADNEVAQINKIIKVTLKGS